MRPKKVKFQTTHPEFDVPKPVPASKAMPDWYRKMQGVENKQMTVKKCVPFLDAMTAGYIISLAADVEFTEEGVVNTSKILVVTSHHPEQTKDLHVSPEYLPTAHKWENLFVMSTPKGYSTIFIHPLNRTDLPFISIAGIVDTDKHPVPVNFPFFIRKDFKGIIPAGTPIIQAIPFKRTSWESTIDEVNPPKETPGLHQMHNPPFGYYKKHWWSRKTYS